MRSIWLIAVALFLVTCRKEKPAPPITEIDLTNITYAPTPFELNLPKHLPQIVIPKDNPLTVEGVELGRHLFYDTRLSLDSTISCASCHLQNISFTDGKAIATGVNNALGKRSSMSLLNVAFTKNGLFWDGREKNLESQALLPIEDPAEMHETWNNVEVKLRRSSMYQKMFRKAFGIERVQGITRDLAVKALAQFQRTLISYDSKYDRVVNQGEDVFTEEELYGLSMYIDDDPDIPDAQCDHCHTLPLATADLFFNNGLQSAKTLNDFKDPGRGKIIGNPLENGFFRAPTLRNVLYTAPYMHDGSLKTIDEVIDHYLSGGHPSPNKDPLIEDIHFSKEEKEHLKAFLRTLSDEKFVNKSAFSNPFDK